MQKIMVGNAHPTINLLLDVAARFIVPHKHGFDKSNNYIKRIQT